ncbi:hypothetical protein CJ030_MR4G025832 [Morella rubra]|uniref:Uncharacterized protein n=1 Tax=Morella rubra TaxID=262757 RepID=A0A6A1VXA0_9ROSI|nr:hypothetical protein CJ030_MR4G025832 [Morella rubra]
MERQREQKDGYSQVCILPRELLRQSASPVMERLLLISPLLPLCRNFFFFSE